MTSVLLAYGSAAAFTLDTYASESALAGGKWVKISVESSGMHAISIADLRQWGFNDPQKVRIHGYGGKRIDDYLSRSNFVDDLPLVQSAVTDKGIVFWATGPEQWDEVDKVMVHSLNPFSTKGYYFLTESDGPAREIPDEGLTPTDSRTYQTTFTQYLYHESDRISPATLGLLLVGEDFRFTPSQDFKFSTPGAVDGCIAKVRVNFLVIGNATSSVALMSSGKPLDKVDGTSFQASADGILQLATGQTPLASDNFSLGIKFTSGGSVNMANLDYIEVEYERNLALTGGKLDFMLTSPAAELDVQGASGVKVWDVTNPLEISNITATSEAGKLRWVNPYSGRRRYAAWSPMAAMPSPKLEAASVPNQNIHGMAVPDMVIIATTENMIQAERIAQLHRDNPAEKLNVMVLKHDQVYNEFGSGVADPGAIRRMAKMMYDRSRANADEGQFRYLLLMGRPTFDNRRLSSTMSTLTYETLPTWTTESSLNENSAYCSDDYFAMLEDNSGLRWGTESLLVAVGRIPSTSNADAKIFTDRLIDYVNKPAGEWATRVVMTADDGNESDHLLQSEDMVDGFRATAAGDNLNYKKVYFGAYTLANGVYADAVSTFRRQIDEGVLMWNYVGHASIDNLTGEGLLTTNDLYNLYLRKPLVFYGATCSFARWDGMRVSGVEALCLRESGGAVAAISAVRPVYITLNGYLSAAFSKEIFREDASGSLPTLGEALMRAKNGVKNDTNKRRYVLLGDPAMRLAIPSNRVAISTVNGHDATDMENPPVISALQKVEMAGVLTDAAGNSLDGFNGVLSFTIYDAEYSVISNETDEKGQEVSFEQQGERVAAGRAKVTDGRFSISLTMPSEIADNYRPGAITLYAVSETGQEASACFRNIYLCGFNDEAAVDDRAPEIEFIHLNHSSFMDGDAVNDEPMLVARVSDDTGINLSTAGVGHQMTVKIDGKLSCSDVATSFTPDADGLPAGDIAYRLPSLTKGEHLAELKVWDVSGNSATASVRFTIDDSLSPSIIDVYTDANPAVTEANFYVTHDRPDEILCVTIEVFDINGRLQWSDTSTGRADMYASAPVRWNLMTQTGVRAPRGIYLYRARIAPASNPEQMSASKTRRLAVAGR